MLYRIKPYKKYAAFIGACIGIVFTLNSYAATDFSRVYRYGGRLHLPVDNPPAGERPIFDVNAEVDTQGVLGCSGLDLGSLVKAQIGDFGSASELGKDIANAVKTRLFRETVTQVLANPQVASVLENLQGLAHARVALVQERCNANEIFANVTNKRLREEGLHRCTQETGSLEECLNNNKLAEYVGKTIENDRWSKGLRFHLCDQEANSNCGWTLLLPDRVTAISQHQSKGYINPALLDTVDITTIAITAATKELNEKTRAAEAAIKTLGYANAFRAAAYTGPGLDPKLIPTNKDRPAAKPYSVFDQRNNQACNYAAETGIRTDISEVINPRPTGGNPTFPITGVKLEKANITSLFGGRTKPCKGCSSFHGGLDFGYPIGTSLSSSVTGLVEKARFETGGGYIVKIRGEDGLSVVYAHMDQINPDITEGITIPEGAFIGTTGNTGAYTSGPHLHFPLKKNGIPIDPLIWLGGDDADTARILNTAEDTHGLLNLAASRSGEEVDNAFTLSLHKQATQLITRLVNSVSCNITQNMHPHVFLRFAIEPGTLGPYNAQDVVNEDLLSFTKQTPYASGNKGALINGLAILYGTNAAIKFYTATINELSYVLATINTGIGGINPALYNSAIGDLGRLKFERKKLADDYKLQCLTAKRLARTVTRQDTAFKNPEAIGFINKISCNTFNHIKDDGGREIDRFLSYTPEDSAQAQRRRGR